MILCRGESALGNNMQECVSKFARYRFFLSVANKEPLGVHYEEHTGAAHKEKRIFNDARLSLSEVYGRGPEQRDLAFCCTEDN